MFAIQTNDKWYSTSEFYEVKNPVLIKTFYITKHHTCYIYKDNDIIFCTTSQLNYFPCESRIDKYDNISYIFLVDYKNEKYFYDNTHNYSISKDYFVTQYSNKKVIAGSKYLWIYFLRLIPKKMSKILQSGVKISDYQSSMTFTDYKIKFYTKKEYDKLHPKLASMPLQWKNTVARLISHNLHNITLYDKLKSVNILRLQKLYEIDEKILSYCMNTIDPNVEIEKMYKKSLKLFKTRNTSRLIINSHTFRDRCRDILISTSDWTTYNKHFRDFFNDYIYESLTN